jgi:hypothetical protein
MKTRFGVNSPANLPVWQPRDKTQHMLHQIKKITRDLHAVQSDLYHELAEEDGTRRKHSPFFGSPGAGDLLALKVAADQLRRTLWFYLEAVSAEESDSGTQSAEIPGREKMVELREPVASVTAPSAGATGSGSFFDRLNLVIDGYLTDRGIAGTSDRRKP